MATALFPRPRTLFRAWRNQKHQRPKADWRRRLFEEPLEQRTVLSAISPVATVLEADFNADGVIGLKDLDLMSCWVGPEGRSNIYYDKMDLNEDGILTRADVHMLADFLRTTPGDADYDGDFDSSDLNTLFVHNQYEDGLVRNSTWRTGDFNGDREFDAKDLIYILKNSVYEPDGDVNGDGKVDVHDLDIANCWIGASGGDCWLYSDRVDINRDGTADKQDIKLLMRLVGTTPGDADLDGMLGTGDLVTLFKAGKFETGEKATWQSGDFNGDGQFTRDDLINAFQESHFGIDALAVDIVFAS